MVIRKLKNWLPFEGNGGRRKVSAQVTKVVMLRFIYNIWVTTIFPFDGALSHFKIWTIFFLLYLQFLNRDALGIKSMRVQSISLRWSLPDTAEKLGTCKMPPRCQISGIPLFSGTGNWGRILCSGKGVQEPRLFMYRGRRARGHSFDFRHREGGAVRSECVFDRREGDYFRLLASQTIQRSGHKFRLQNTEDTCFMA